MERTQVRLGLVGFGEVGSTIGKGLRAAGLSTIHCYDKGAFNGSYSRLIRSRAEEADVVLVRTREELAAAADLIVSFTPGSASIDSAKAFANILGKSHTFVDFASATPKVKFAVADILEKSGASVGDGSILGNPSNGYAMPMLVSGPASAEVTTKLVPWGLRIDIAGERLGVASGIKILRSVLFKGLEALFDEMILAARGYQMDSAVLASAFNTLDRSTWAEILQNIVPSGALHARRRAEELEMAAEAVEGAGVEPIMTRAGAQRLRWKEKLGLKQHFEGIQPETTEEVFRAIELLLASKRVGADVNVAANQGVITLDSVEDRNKDATLPGHRANSSPSLVPQQLITAFANIAVATISDNMNRLHGTRALRPFHPSRRLVGTAITVKTRPGDNLAILQALKTLRPGDVLVVDGGGDINHALAGKLMMSAAQAAGAAGFVFDGAIRDVAAFEEADFPCFARGVTHRGPYKLGPGEINVPVSVDGMIVNPGDLIVGDEDGLIAFDRKFAEELLVRVQQQDLREAQALDSIRAGVADSYTTVAAAPK